MGLHTLTGHYSKLVVPIVYENQNGDFSIGTGFRFNHALVTAKHCIEGAKSISIKGFYAEQLKNALVTTSTNPEVDILAFCFFNYKDPDSITFYREAEILEDVLEMGYPKIPGFTDSLTAEKATVSSKAEMCLTPTTGQVASAADNIFAKIPLLLVTAKIRGGNSGGPIVGADGSIIGVASQMPSYEGDYDDLGYGTAVPISEVTNAILHLYQFNTSKIEFKDFIE